MLWVLACILLLMNGCFKEKPMARPSSTGAGQTNIIDMGPDYTNQFFYSLATNKVLSQNSRFAYDLMFDCDADKFHIWLNSGKFMVAVKTNKTDFNAVTMSDTTGGDWKYELGAYSVDSSALGQWWSAAGAEPVSDGRVYIINQGTDLNGNNMGFVKMKVNNFYGSTYSITYSSLTSVDSGTVQIMKDATRNYKYVNLANGGQVLENIEPDKSTWDLCFTHYTVVFYVPYYLPYQVTGVLTNPARVHAYVDSTIDYSKVAINDFNVNKLSPSRDGVGFEWKIYTNNHYTAKPYYVYFIKADEDRFYKLHFLDFNKDGVKGYPTFEYQQL